MKNIVNLVDISNFFYSTVHSICGYKGNKLKTHQIGKYLEEKEEKEEYLALLDSNIKQYVPRIKHSQGVIFVFDTFEDKSYRYDIFPDYKKKRKDVVKAFNSKELKECVKEYKEYLESQGFQTLYKNRLEADDIISITSKKLLKEGFSVVICSDDGDLKQLVKNDGDLGIYFYSMKDSAVFVEKGFEKPKMGDEEFGGIFSDFEDFEVDKIFDSATEIDPMYVIWEKVVSGDTSDSIPASLNYKKGNSLMNVTDKRIQKLFENIDVPREIDWYILENQIQEPLNDILKTKKNPKILRLTEEHKNNFELNRKIVVLDENVVPDYIVDEVIKDLSKIEYDVKRDFSILDKPMVEKQGKNWDEI